MTFDGGWITRAYGKPGQGVEALQLELACRAYMQEPERPAVDNWPAPIDEEPSAAPAPRNRRSTSSKRSRGEKTSFSPRPLRERGRG